MVDVLNAPVGDQGKVLPERSAQADAIRRFGRPFAVLAGLALALAPVLLVASLFDDSYRLFVVTTGLVSLGVIGLPFLLVKDVHPLDPIVLVFVAVLIGTALRSVYIGYSDNPRAEEIMWGLSYAQIAGQSMWLALGLLAIALGHLATSARIPLEKMRFFFDRPLRLTGRFWLATLVAVLLTILGIVLFVDAFGISFSLDSISAKRSLAIVTDDGEEVFAALGYIRVLNGFASSALLLFVIAKLHGGQKFGLQSIAIILFLFGLASVVPFITSSRSTILIMIINVVAAFMVYGKIGYRHALYSIVLLLLVTWGMGNLRAMGSGEDVGAHSTIIDSVVGSGNFVDMGRTSAIITKVPENTDHLWGQSYTSLFSFAVPRSLWPEKPDVSLGPWVKAEIFGLQVKNNGWPPNIIAEAYINFGYLGILVIGFLFGAFCKLIFNSFRPLLGTNPLATAIYISIYWSLGMRLVQSNFSLGMTQILSIIAVLVPFLVLATTRARRHS